jgi:hypothetical protein
MYPIDFEYALEFKRVLKIRFPNANFNLVIINHSDEGNSMTIEDEIIVFTLLPPTEDYCNELKWVFNVLTELANIP